MSLVKKSENELLRIRAELFQQQDLPFREFTLRGTPGASEVIGVRVPKVRSIAKRICQNDFRSYLEAKPKIYLEELLLHGIIIAQAPIQFTERQQYLAQFIPQIQNWLVCDTVANSFRIEISERAKYWDFLGRYLDHTEEFAVRFAIVMMLDHFLTTDYIAEVLQCIDAVTHRGYYVEMAKAWLVAEALVRDRNIALSYFYDNHLSDFAFNKAIQKARESYRVSVDDKILLAKLKRKPK